MIYMLVTLSWGGKVQGRTTEQNYENDLYDRARILKDKEIVRAVEEKERPEVYQGEDTTNLNDYRLQDLDLRRGNCFKGLTPVIHGEVQVKCKEGCRLTCIPNK